MSLSIISLSPLLLLGLLAIILLFVAGAIAFVVRWAQRSRSRG